MSEKTIHDMVQQFGPPDEWLLSVDEIERIMLTVTCSHGLRPVDACRECFVGALVARQVAVLAERMGCTPEDAAAVGETLVRRHQEEPTDDHD